jgi:hypothetical protein
MFFMDGTFKSAPKLFMQIYTLHCFVMGFMVPMVSMLSFQKLIYNILYKYIPIKYSYFYTYLLNIYTRTIYIYFYFVYNNISTDLMTY